MEPILQVRDLWITFKRLGAGIGPRNVNAVKDVSFDLGESEIFSLVGESGSGKTTLGKGIARLVLPTKGSILYNGKNVMKLRGEELRKYRADVQMVFQDPFGSLNPRYDVLTTLSEPLQYLSHLKDPTEIKEHSSKLLEEVGLDSERVLTRYPHQLSGGERQRVNIARAIASEPKILIADEPITMLDAEQRLSVLSLLMELKLKRRLSVLFITHDLASAKLVSDRIMVMYLGKIVESGEAEAVLSKPHHPYAEVILKAMPTLHRQDDGAQSLLKTATREDLVMKGCAFRPKCAYANEKCSEIEPPLVEITKSHYAACHWPLNSN
ncbi:MAG: ABC transporter ATP-binding protein [Thaumarchaeota archaeon]|nr:ABC transporter ATP-binding protein [Nitrososphaerota archaeon]